MVGDAHVAAATGEGAHRPDAHAVASLLGLDVGCDIVHYQRVAAGVERRCRRHEAMQKGEMLRVDIPLMTLQPIALMI